MKIDFKQKEDNALLMTLLPEVIDGLREVIDDIKEQFNKLIGRRLDRIIYITLTHSGLKPGVKVGPLNLKDDTNEIVRTLHEKINAVLESHHTLECNESLNIYIVVLGDPHMVLIKSQETKALSILDKVGGSNDVAEKFMAKYFLKLPEDKLFDGLCIPLSLILSAVVQRYEACRGYKTMTKKTKKTKTGYMVKGKQMKQINSKSGSRKRIAVDALKKEFDKKKEKLRCCQDEPYKFKLQPILRHLANHYEVNFVIHSLKQSVFFISCKPNNNKSNFKTFPFSHEFCKFSAFSLKYNCGQRPRICKFACMRPQNFATGLLLRGRQRILQITAEHSDTYYCKNLAFPYDGFV